jgi:hypothetical protein
VVQKSGNSSNENIKKRYHFQPKLEAERARDEYFLIQIDQIIGENLYLWKNDQGANQLLFVVECTNLRGTQRRKLLPQEGYSGQIYIGNNTVHETHAEEGSHKPISLTTLGFSLVRSDENHQKGSYGSLHPGMDLSCFVLKHSDEHNNKVGNFFLTVGKPLGDRYFEVYPWGTQEYKEAYEKLKIIDNKLSCVPVTDPTTENQKEVTPKPHQSKLATITKLGGSKHNKIRADSFGDSDEVIFIISLSKNAIVEI